ncbi:MAG: hypothetical protein Q8K19_12070 [Methylicorpusculum sp.]|uniref:hypothetical protein n=1 Tax=Methylicorpusculum sp. TaxID=2713644 RepID=UPI002731D89A|nr:hypothetical protein [Methylicorpusculum sp.]MDP2179230.1 hypothetical protein [Methylicorpusculum sp.]
MPPSLSDLVRKLGCAKLKHLANQNTFCRERGLFTHHLQTWKQDFIKPLETDEPSSASRKAAKPLQDEIVQLKKDLQRKEKALAEAAALLILQKKYHAFWEEKAP